MKNKNQKIALVVSSFPKLSETFVVNHFFSLLEKGWNVEMICSRFCIENSEHSSRLREPEVRKRIRVMSPTHSRLLALLLWPFLLIQCLFFRPLEVFRYFSHGYKRLGLKILKHFYFDAAFILSKPDIIHFEFGALAVGRMHLKGLLSARVVVSFRGYDINHVGIEEAAYYEEVWNKSDAIHCLGEALWKQALKRNCPEDKTPFFIPPAVDAVSFQSQKRVLDSKEKIRIFSVGRLEWKKGYEFALQAIKLLSDRGVDFEYSIIGDGPYWEALHYCVHQLGMTNRVKLLGAMKQEEVFKQLRTADIFLHAAVSEGFCNAVLEAQAMGIPVVTSHAGGLSENVLDTVTGYVVPSRHPLALAEKMEWLIENPQMAQEMGRAGRDRALKGFTLSQQIEKFEKLYEQVALQLK